MKTNKKINVFINDNYYCSTIHYKTCKDAKIGVKNNLQNKTKYLPCFIDIENLETIKISAYFDKK